MKRLIAVLLIAACGAALAQSERLLLSPEGMQKLQELRLQKSKEFALDLPLSGKTRRKLLETDDRLVIDSVLKAQSTVPRLKLEADTVARSRLVALSRASDVDLQKALLSAGFSHDKLLESARLSINPQDDLKALPSTIFFNREGRAVFGKPSVFVTNPGEVAPDNLAPGMPFKGKPIAGSGGGKPIYRQGFRYAGLLAVAREGSFQMVCSGTVVAKYWLVTAAHCLFNESMPGRYTTSQLAVFLPMQGGLETVRGFSGDNKAMKRIAVEATVWMGDEANIVFPASKGDFDPVILQGRDLAMLRLNPQQVDALPNPLGDVRLYSGTPPETATTVVGYGVTDAANTTSMSLLPGFRGELPYGATNGDDVLQFGAPGSSGAAGICGGDSGGGLFVGRIDGTQARPQLIGVISGLVADSSSSAQVCIASAQLHSSLLSQRNRQFVCGRAPAACA